MLSASGTPNTLSMSITMGAITTTSIESPTATCSKAYPVLKVVRWRQTKITAVEGAAVHQQYPR